MMTTADQTSTPVTPDTAPANAGLSAQIDKAKAFAKQKPWAVGTLLAILGVATINTLRGRNS